MMFNMDGMIPV